MIRIVEWARGIGASIVHYLATAAFPLLFEVVALLYLDEYVPDQRRVLGQS